jgi:hypothetical protein
MAVDFSSLQEVVVRQYTDGPAGSDWTRLRQAGASTPTASGAVVTPGPDEVPFRAFVTEQGKSTVKQPAGQGDNQDESIILWTCKIQQINGLDEEVDFTAANEAAGVRGDTVRREPDGTLYEVQNARLERAGGFWALTVRQVQDG